MHLLTTDSDLLVTEPAGAGTAFADLEVRPTSPEEAFITITSKEEARVQPHLTHTRYQFLEQLRVPIALVAGAVSRRTRGLPKCPRVDWRVSVRPSPPRHHCAGHEHGLDDHEMRSSRWARSAFSRTSV